MVAIIRQSPLYVKLIWCGFAADYRSSSSRLSVNHTTYESIFSQRPRMQQLSVYLIEPKVERDWNEQRRITESSPFKFPVLKSVPIVGIKGVDSSRACYEYGLQVIQTTNSFVRYLTTFRELLGSVKFVPSRQRAGNKRTQAANWDCHGSLKHRSARSKVLRLMKRRALVATAVELCVLKLRSIDRLADRQDSCTSLKVAWRRRFLTVSFSMLGV